MGDPVGVIDEVLTGTLPTILQAPDGYRYSVDPFLLCGFATIPLNAQVADLGTGSGIIPLLLAGKERGRRFVGFELQPEMSARAAQNVESNRLEGRIRIVTADIRHLPEEFGAGSFDAVMTNPPYRTPSSGRVAPGPERSAARHELAGGLVDFLRAATFLLDNRGHFFIVYLADRLAELLGEMRACRLQPKRLRMVHSRAGEPAKLVLVEGRKNAGAGLVVEPPLFIYREGVGRVYSEEMLRFFEVESH